MSTSYPAALDNLTNPAATDPLSSPSHSSQHANANDAIEAMQAAMGVKLNARVRATRTTTQSITNTTDTAIAFTTEDFDTDAFHDNVTNNSRLTVPASMGGIYLIIANVEFAANATGLRQLTMRINGNAATTNTVGMANTPTGNATRISRLSASGIVSLSAADYVEAYVFQESGGNLNVNVAQLMMVKIA